MHSNIFTSFKGIYCIIKFTPLILLKFTTRIKFNTINSSEVLKINPCLFFKDSQHSCHDSFLVSFFMKQTLNKTRF